MYDGSPTSTSSGASEGSGEGSSLLKQRTILARFGELALRSDDLDELLAVACRLMAEGVGTDLAKVVELQEDGKTLLVRAGVGWKPGVVGKVTLQVAEGTSEGYAFKTGEPVISPDVATETRFTYPAFLVENGIKAVANVLILGAKGKPPFGILQVDSRTPHHFTDSDTAFLRSYANLIAATVDRLRVLRETREGEARLRLALEAGELGSWSINLAGGAATRTHQNDRIFGCSADCEWNYAIFLGHILPGDRELVDRTFRAAAEAGTGWKVDCRIMRADGGRVRWVEMQGRPIAGHGLAGSTHMVGVVADITERRAVGDGLLRSNERLEAGVADRTRELLEAGDRLKREAEERGRVEEALRQSHKMEAVGQLTGGLAHDFNNLLAGISGSLELIGMHATKERTAKLGHYVATALQSVNRAAALTHRLLAFSRPQALDPRSVSMNRLVAGMEDLVRRTVGPGIQVGISLAAGLCPALCDPNQLESALLNLVINARDAMPGGGRLVIGTTDGPLPDQEGGLGEAWLGGAASAEGASRHACLFVTDSGTGMTPEVAARALDPFFTTKPAGQGTGLGLSMVYGFVQQSGGHVRMRSREGHGTTVALYLPRCNRGVDGEEAAEMAGPPLAEAGGVVLVVDDEPTVRMVVSDMLTDLGYQVLQAADGRTALGVLASSATVDLLLTDLGLPGGMDGRQLAEVARQERPGLRTLFVTGYADAALSGAGPAGPGMQIMVKPFLADALANQVRQTLLS